MFYKIYSSLTSLFSLHFSFGPIKPIMWPHVSKLLVSQLTTQISRNPTSSHKSHFPLSPFPTCDIKRERERLNSDGPALAVAYKGDAVHLRVCDFSSAWLSDLFAGLVVSFCFSFSLIESISDMWFPWILGFDMGFWSLFVIWYDIRSSYFVSALINWCDLIL